MSYTDGNVHYDIIFYIIMIYLGIELSNDRIYFEYIFLKILLVNIKDIGIFNRFKSLL